MKISLYKFGPQWGIADPSPFCMKLEGYLRLAGIQHDIPDFDMSFFKKAPKGKFPFITDENGTSIGDSELIIRHLIASGEKDLDADLSAEEKAISLSFLRLLDDHLYWVLLFSRWQDDAGWSVIKPLFFGDLPVFIRGLIENSQRSKIIKKIKDQGLGVHSDDEIYAKGVEDVKALSNFLADKKYMVSKNTATLLDICLYSYVVNFALAPIENPVKECVLAHGNLLEHAKRVHKLIYKDDTLNIAK